MSSFCVDNIGISIDEFPACFFSFWVRVYFRLLEARSDFCGGFVTFDGLGFKYFLDFLASLILDCFSSPFDF